ncbi:hypothetical protein FW781_00655 (plasmid) [Chryseobacterium panacisoli]|uniref:Uncharacterized protein n=1 Tax=Chryseobacterium panacisoli TaxID=1807141 RepID=A0A5D8ZV71_9FLAO|nr:hypothetical protein [Chryseobacterium panacisoli]TZF98471.1 hypothetical protein FW781_00655 [Chryseobacterium panacisoli]
MKQIPTEETFSSPQWLKILCYFFGPLIIVTGFGLLIQKDLPQEIIFLVPLLLLIAVSMLMYTRLKLIISNTDIRFTGGLKQHQILWTDITGIDMKMVGKYQTPICTLYYGKKSLELNRGFYLKRQFNRILSLLEMKAAPELFTEKYQGIRRQIS